MSISQPHRRRLRSTVLLATLAMLAAFFTGCSPAGHLQHVDPVQAEPVSAPEHVHVINETGKVPASQLELRQTMRMLWGQHMEWTRMAVVDFAAGSDGFASTAGRLLQNQADIGNAIKPFYGDAAGDQLTVLLKAHITGFVGLFQAAKANDAAGLEQAKAAVYANAQEIADFLANANPKYWPQEQMRDMMKGHIDQTIEYGSDQLNGNYAAGIAVYDQAEAHMMMMADDLSAGLIGAFPKMFR